MREIFILKIWTTLTKKELVDFFSLGMYSIVSYFLDFEFDLYFIEIPNDISAGRVHFRKPLSFNMQNLLMHSRKNNKLWHYRNLSISAVLYSHILIWKLTIYNKNYFKKFILFEFFPATFTIFYQVPTHKPQ